jgi:hypothetical protein
VRQNRRFDSREHGARESVIVFDSVGEEVVKLTRRYT